MERIFLSGITIENVRHLRQIAIPLSRDKAKHLIFTGKNGSGKTSVLEALSVCLHSILWGDNRADRVEELSSSLEYHQDVLKELRLQGIEDERTLEEESQVTYYESELYALKNGLNLEFSQPEGALKYCYQKGQFVAAYYRADRIFQADTPQHVEKVELQDCYAVTDSPRRIFMKYLLDMEVTEALARNKGNHEKADKIREWRELRNQHS